MRATYDYRCTACGTVTERTYPAGGAPAVLTDECEGCTRYVSEYHRVVSVPVLPGAGAGKPC